MSEFAEKLANKIVSEDRYKEAMESLFSSYVELHIGENSTISRENIKKLLTTAQVFQQTRNSVFEKEGAAILAMLLDVCANEHQDLHVVAREMFIDQGDFPNVELLKARYRDSELELGFYSRAQQEFRQSLNTVEGLDFLLTDFQRALWDDLASEQDVITAAPTSAGKTHIILNYLVKRISESDGAFAAIIVPTRALISEVAGNIYEIARTRGAENAIEICTIPRDGDFSDRTLFVVTQERLYELLQRGDVFFDYLFIDEAHNISDKSRGVLLHLTIDRMLEDSNPQIIVSMPSDSYQNSFSTIFQGVDFQKEITTHSPVAKLLIDVVPKGRELIISRRNMEAAKKIKKNFTGKSLADIVFRLGVGQSNIVYRNQTDHCEKMAEDLAELIGDQSENPALEEAADYVEKFIHSEFSLAKNLRKGVAFHYGPLPSSVRVMVENLVKENHLKYVACTSTLAEGVNLPAKNLFLKNPLQRVPLKPSERLEDVKVNNITGRAGRMLQHFSGNIFLVEPDDWQFKDYFENDQDDQEEKIPSFYKSLNDEFDGVIRALNGAYDHDDSDQYRFYTIANKLVKEFSSGRLQDTLRAKELKLEVDAIAFLEKKVGEAFDNLKVAPLILDASPTVGYIQQNKLYSFIASQSQLDDWLLPHPKSSDVYSKLCKISMKLNEFGLYKPTESYSIEYVSLIARKWIQGNSLKEIISEQIVWDKDERDMDNVNGSVRSVIKVINNDIRFRFSNAFRCYEVLLDAELANRGLEFANTKLHSFFEIGACDERMISLINMGLSREASKEIDTQLPQGFNINTIDELLKVYREKKLSEIHAITEKELLKLFSAK